MKRLVVALLLAGFIAPGVSASLQVERILARQTARTHLHHSDPMFLGGSRKQPLTSLTQGDHAALHSDLNSFLRGRVDAFGNHMAPTRANPGALIRGNFTRAERLQTLADFYRGPGSKYEQAAIDFFSQHPGL